MAMATAGFSSSLTEFLRTNPDYFGQWGNIMAEQGQAGGAFSGLSEAQQSVIEAAMNSVAIVNFGYDSYQEKRIEEDAITTIKRPDKFKQSKVDKITNFNPSTDILEIDTDSFGIDSSATFATAKNKRKLRKLTKKEFDFLYDQKKGGLYFNENGSDKGFGDGGIIAILKGAPELTASNLEFI